MDKECLSTAHSRCFDFDRSPVQAYSVDHVRVAVMRGAGRYGGASMDQQHETSREEAILTKLVWQSPVLTKASIEDAEITVNPGADGVAVS